MGGEFLFAVAEWLVRTMVRLVRTRGVNTWPAAKAEVTSSTCATGFAGSVAEIYYKYVVDGEIYTGIYEKPFLLPTSAEDYVRKRATGVELTIRVKPVDPSVSAVLDRDQVIPYTVDAHRL